MFILNQQTLFFSDLMNKFKQVPKKSSSLRLFKKSKERKAKNLSFLAPSKKYILIEEFTDEIKGLKNILNETKKKLDLLREQETSEIKNDTKRKFNMLDDEISNISETLDVDLTTSLLRCEIFKNFERERELGLSSAKEKINKIERLKKKLKTMSMNY